MDNTLPWSHGQQLAIEILVLVSSGLSVIACSLIIIAYVSWKEFRVFHLRLILILATVDLISSVSFIFGALTRDDINNKWICVPQAIITQFSNLASGFWTAAIAHSIYLTVTRSPDEAEEEEVSYHIVCWSTTIIFTVTPMLSESYGDAGLWCWLTDNEPWLRLMCFYLPSIFVILFNVCCYAAALKEMDSFFSHASLSTTFTLFLLAFILSTVWGFANRIENYLHPNQPTYWLYACQAFFSPLNGFTNALVYGLNQDVRAKIKAKWYSGTGWMNRDTSMMNAEISASYQSTDIFRRPHKIGVGDVSTSSIQSTDTIPTHVEYASDPENSYGSRLRYTFRGSVPPVYEDLIYESASDSGEDVIEVAIEPSPSQNDLRIVK